MRLAQWMLKTSILVLNASLAVPSPLLHMPVLRQCDDLGELARRASDYCYDRTLGPRSPQATTTEDSLSLDAPDVEQNVSTSSACMNGLQGFTDVSNEPGFAACYNILDWHANMGGMFQADLRLFQFSSPTGNFSDVPVNAITVQLQYPNSTQFSILTNAKRNVGTLEVRQNAPTEIQQYSLIGNFKLSLDLKKLNSTQLMSLLIPQIKLSATMNGIGMDAMVEPSDTVYFVAGQFKDDNTPQIVAQAAKPAMALAAIEASQGFVLPGTTFGIFPTGLIVTGAWTVLFFLAFGLGTIGRMRHRDLYRRRVAATSKLGRQ